MGCCESKGPSLILITMETFRVPNSKSVSFTTPHALVERLAVYQVVQSEVATKVHKIERSRVQSLERCRVQSGSQALCRGPSPVVEKVDSD
jgi:hypothetical protein